MASFTEEILKSLDDSEGERLIARFLKSNPDLVFWAFINLGGHTHYVVPDFGIGKALFCDFLLLQSFSGGWNVHFIELEPVRDPLYNKDRTPSRRLRIAQKQIADWRRYVATNEASLRNQLADAAKPKYCLQSKEISEEPASFSGHRLRDIYTYVDYHYHIIIGRRSDLSDDKNFYRSSSYEHDAIDIVSYDRLVEVAKRLDNIRSKKQT